MLFLRTLLLVVACQIAMTCAVHAACLLPEPTGYCPPTAGTKQGGPPSLFQVQLPKKKLSLLKDNLYTVDVSCEQVKVDGTNSAWGLFSGKNIASSHVIAITDTRLSQPIFPTNPRASFTVFSVSGAQKDKNVFINKGCKTKFLIAGRDPIYLAVTASRVETNEPSLFTKLIYQLIKVALPVGPLFKDTSFVTDVKPILEDVGKTEQPLKDLLSTLDKGSTYTEPYDIFENTTVITTDFSRVLIKVSRIKSLMATNDNDLINSYEKSMSDHINDMKAAALSTGDIKAKCGLLGNTLINRNLSSSDIAYALAYISRLADMSISKTVGCLGRDYALPALEYTELWEGYPDPITKDIIGSLLVDEDPMQDQPDFSEVSYRLGKTVRSLGRAVQEFKKSAISPDKTLEPYFAGELEVQNLTEYFDFEEKKLKPSDLVIALASKDTALWMFNF